MGTITKKLLVLSILTITLTAGIAMGNQMSKKFTDSTEIPEWASQAVESLSEMGVINGYEDGSFGPNDNVSRAQLATIIHRYDDSKKTESLDSQSLINSLMFYSKLENTELDSELKSALALASAKINPIDAPNAKNNFSLSQVCEFKDENLEDYGAITQVVSEEIPQNYTLYVCDQDPNYGAGIFVNYQYEGGIPNSGEFGIINEWYGPYSELMFW